MDSALKIVALARAWMPLSRRVRILTAILPRSWWFRAGLLLSSVQTTTTRLLGRRDTPLQDALLLDYWLVQLTKAGPFPIPYQVVGARHLHHKTDDKAGLVYAGIHLPCYTVAIRALEDLHARPSFAIASSVSIGPDGNYPLVGLEEGLPAVAPGASALIRTKRELSRNGTVVSMLDSHIGMPLTRQLLQLAGRVGARVIFFWTERTLDGTIKVIFADPPFVICDTETKIEANLEAVQFERDRIIASLYPHESTATVI